MVLSKGENLFLLFAKFIYSLVEPSEEKSGETGSRVTEWSILPEKPREGDTLIIKGKAAGQYTGYRGLILKIGACTGWPL